jgi:hypothetical protein
VKVVHKMHLQQPEGHNPTVAFTLVQTCPPPHLPTATPLEQQIAGDFSRTRPALGCRGCSAVGQPLRPVILSSLLLLTHVLPPSSQVLRPIGLTAGLSCICGYAFVTLAADSRGYAFVTNTTDLL